MLTGCSFHAELCSVSRGTYELERPSRECRPAYRSLFSPLKYSDEFYQSHSRFGQGARRSLRSRRRTPSPSRCISSEGRVADWLLYRLSPEPTKPCASAPS